MKTTKLLISCLMLFPLIGCATTGTPNPGGQPDWDKLAPTIQSRVRYVATFAFSMKQVQPHKAQICDIATNISNMLDNYNDKDASFETVRIAVMDLIGQIPDPALRNGATILVDIALTEAFNYAWSHYEDMLNGNEVQTTILVARAIGAGLREACSITISAMNADQEHYVYNGFTAAPK